MIYRPVSVIAWQRLVAFVTVLLVALQVKAEDPGLYLHQFVTETSTPANASTLADEVSLKLYHRDPAALKSALANTTLSVVETGADFLKVLSRDEGRLLTPLAPSDQQASFIVDFTENSVVELTNAAREEFGAEPSIDDLNQFVYSTIGLKTFKRGFDMASSVASRKEGDCTEHAVLLTALARSLGRPARIVFGVLLLRHEENVAGLGHAWTEIYDDGKWVLVDATRPELTLAGTDIHYLPLTTLTDEGPGFSMSMYEALALFPLKLSEISAAER